MTTQDQTYDVPVRIDDSKQVYVTNVTATVIRDELNGQADRWLREAKALWDECDVEDIDDIKAIEDKIGRFADALSALRWLAPMPDEDSE
jgi:hypothetical protein